MRFHLRTLLIVLTMGPLLIWGGYLAWQKYQSSRMVNDGLGFDPRTNSYVPERR